MKVIIIHTHNSLDPEFKYIFAVVWAKDTIVCFEELHDELMEYEAYIKCEEDRSSNGLTSNMAHFTRSKKWEPIPTKEEQPSKD